METHVCARATVAFVLALLAAPTLALDLLGPSGHASAALTCLPSDFGPPADGETGPLVVPEPSTGCATIETNLTGSVALLTWGGEVGQPDSCRHTDRVRRCQQAGAIGVVMMLSDPDGRDLFYMPMAKALWEPMTSLSDILIPSVTVPAGVAQRRLLPAVAAAGNSTTQAAAVRLSFTDIEQRTANGFLFQRWFYGLSNGIACVVAGVCLGWWHQRQPRPFWTIRKTALAMEVIIGGSACLDNVLDAWNTVGIYPNWWSYNIVRSISIAGCFLASATLTIYFTELWLNTASRELLFVDRFAPVLVFAIIGVFAIDAIKYVLILTTNHASAWIWSNVWMTIGQTGALSPIMLIAQRGIYRALKGTTSVTKIQKSAPRVTLRFKVMLGMSVVTALLFALGTCTAAMWALTPLAFGPATFMAYNVIWNTTIINLGPWTISLFWPRPSIAPSRAQRRAETLRERRAQYVRELQSGMYEGNQVVLDALPDGDAPASDDADDDRTAIAAADLENPQA